MLLAADSSVSGFEILRAPWWLVTSIFHVLFFCQVGLTLLRHFLLICGRIWSQLINNFQHVRTTSFRPGNAGSWSLSPHNGSDLSARSIRGCWFPASPGTQMQEIADRTFFGPARSNTIQTPNRNRINEEIVFFDPTPRSQPCSPHLDRKSAGGDFLQPRPSDRSWERTPTHSEARKTKFHHYFRGESSSCERPESLKM